MSGHSVLPRRPPRGPPLWLALTLPLAVLLVATAGSLAHLGHRAARDSVALMVQQRLLDLGHRVSAELDDYLGTAWRFAGFNQLALAAGTPDPADLPALRGHFVRQLGRFDTLTLLSFTDIAGMHLSVAVDRQGLAGPPGTLLARHAPAPAPATAVDSILDASGRPLRTIRREADYDPRQRPWYLKTLEQDRQGWLPVHQYPGYPAAALAVTTPVRRDQRLLGVLTVEIMLLDFNDFLASLLEIPDSQVLVVDGDGRLIATSSGETVFQAGGEVPYPPRLRLDDSDHRLTRLAAPQPTDPDDPAAASRQVRDPDTGARYFLHWLPYPNAMGLNWWIAVTVPRDRFMGGIDQVRRHSLGLLLLATALGLLLGGYGARRMSRELARVEQALQRAGTAESVFAPPTTRIRELNDLHRGVARMSRRLATSLAALRDSEQRFSTLLESVPVGVSVLDGTGRAILINRAGREILHSGLEALVLDEFVRRALLHHPGSERPFQLEELPAWRALRGETMRGVAMDLQQGARRIPLEVSTAPVRDAEGRVIAVINAFQDISARREMEHLQQSYQAELEQAVTARTRELQTTVAQREAQRAVLEASEARLQESERRLRTIVDKLPVPLAVWEEPWRRLSFNQTWHEAFGYTPEQIPTHEDWYRHAYPDPDYRRMLWERMQQRINTGAESPQGGDEPVEVCCADGSRRWGFFALARVGGLGLVSFRDITDQHLAGIVLRQSKETAERANRAKDLFLATMSHELRTPLNGILGFAQILAADADLGESQRRGLQVIRRSGKHLLALIEDLLDIAHIEAGRMELANRDLTLDTLALEVVELARGRASARGLALQHTVTGLPPLRGDARRLRQVLSNLLDNAIKYTVAGTVSLRVEALDGADDGDHRRVRVVVDDTGGGIPANRIQQALAPFEQIHDNPLPRAGVGLGLALCHRLVALMGGELLLQSRVAGAPWGASRPHAVPPDDRPHGTRVSFSLTLARAAAPAGAAPLPGGYGGARRRILVVDDLPDNREVLRGLLTALDFRVVTASDADTALRMVAEQSVDLCIIDLLMPGRDGLALIRELRRLPRSGHLPLIAASASVLEGIRQHALDAGADGFLPKPVDAAGLYRQLGTLLGLDWEYGPVPPATVPEPLVIPPGALRRRFGELVSEGDVAALLTQIETELHSYPAFQARLRELARGFRLNELERWLTLLDDGGERA